MKALYHSDSILYYCNLCFTDKQRIWFETLYKITVWRLFYGIKWRGEQVVRRVVSVTPFHKGFSATQSLDSKKSERVCTRHPET